MTQIDWGKARKGFDFHFKGKAGADTGEFYFISPLNDRFVSETGSYILFRGMKDLPKLFEISMRPDDSAWNGEGLPPVGTVCEWRGPNSDGPNGWVYAESKVVAYTEDGLFVCMQAPSCWPVVQRIDNCEFRPIRTPAQLAAEEREKAIEEMTESSLYGHYAFTKAQAKIACGVLYDVGYRKVEVKP